MEQSLADWAIAYAKSLNWYIFPLAPRGKTPITPNGFKDATNDIERIKQWWTQTPNANIGVDCGRSELAVVDLDGAAAIDRWEVIYDSIGAPELRYGIAATGGGGKHIVYAQGPRRIRNTSGKLGKGIDTRGDGGYIVLAPSIHPSGNPYAWVDEPFYGIDSLPDDLIDLILYTPVPPAAQAAPIQNPKGAVRAAVNKIISAQQGARNTVLSNQTWFLFHLVKDGQLPRNVAIEALQYAAKTIGLTDREIEATINSKARLFLGG